MILKKHLHILCFLALIALKVSAIHVYVHDDHCGDHIDDCELCEHAFYNQNLEFSTPTEVQLINGDDIPSFRRQKQYYKSVVLSPLLRNALVVRPPPYFM